MSFYIAPNGCYNEWRTNAMKKRVAYQVITDVKSCPVGIDWLMVMAAKQMPRHQLNPRRHRDDISISDRAKRELVYTH